MFERYTDRARKAMELSREEAQRLGHVEVNTEHILLGIFKQGPCVATSVCAKLGVDVRKIGEAIEKAVESRPPMKKSGELPRAPGAKGVIEFAMEEARAFSDYYVGTEHLLLGLLREHGSTAETVLSAEGVRLDTTRQCIADLRGKPHTGC